MVMNSAEWISRNVSHWLPSADSLKKLALATAGRTSPSAVAQRAGDPDKKEAPPVRLSGERLKATFRRGGEVMSPRQLRSTLDQLRSIIDAQVSKVEGGRRASEFARWYAQAKPDERRDCWWLMSEQFAPDAQLVSVARQQYEAALGTVDEGRAEMALRLALVSPRARLLQRFAAFENGVRFLVEMRAQLLPHVKSDPRLLALDGELQGLFSTWFDVAFLELRSISWDSPASMLEKLIQYEAVHDIRGWSDLKNRLDSDRRCYGFFHPRLPNEPLIFVEVALLDALPQRIGPLLDESAAAANISKASHAIFYSISNTQRGLHGVSFGDSLIKQVVETLKQEFAQLKVFATLSPIPGFRAWLTRHADEMLARLDDKARAALTAALGVPVLDPKSVLVAAESVPSLDEKSPLRLWLKGCAAYYLADAFQDGKPVDPVTRFHLGNGARVEQINWSADLSAKGLKQSFGMMVNYQYDLKRLDTYRAQFASGKMAVSGRVRALKL